MKQNIMMALAALSADGMINENNHYQSPFDTGIKEVQKDFQDLKKDTQRLEAGG
jgi:hypothetical protein